MSAICVSTFVVVRLVAHLAVVRRVEERRNTGEDREMVAMVEQVDLRAAALAVHARIHSIRGQYLKIVNRKLRYTNQRKQNNKPEYGSPSSTTTHASVEDRPASMVPCVRPNTASDPAPTSFASYNDSALL